MLKPSPTNRSRKIQSHHHPRRRNHTKKLPYTERWNRTGQKEKRAGNNRSKWLPVAQKEGEEVKEATEDAECASNRCPVV